MPNPNDPDYVVVGSGLSALAFGALAARSGRRVIVLEGHDKPGGYAHTFDVGAHRFNAQLHYVWNAGEGRTVHRFLRHLGLEDEVRFVRLDPNGYDRMRIPGYALDVPSDHGVLLERLVALFPGHEASLRGFVDEVVRTDAALESLPEGPRDLRALLDVRGLVALHRNRGATLGDVFERHGVPPVARALLASQWVDFLLPPARLSFLAWVMLFAGYARGAYYPEKHFHHVVDSLVDCIRRHGGEVLLRRRVVGFLLADDGTNAVRGVTAERLDAHGAGTGEFDEFRAQTTISNMDPRRAAELIGIERFAPRVRARLAYDYSPSSFVAYCSVRGLDLREHGFGAWNVFHSDDEDLDGMFEAMVRRGDYSRISFSMSTPSLVSSAPGICPPDEQLLELLTVADHGRFLALKLDDPRAYRDAKQHIFDTMLDRIERHYVPGLRDKLSLKVLGSPTTNERFVRAPGGNSYGAALTPRRMWRDHLGAGTSLPNLHFCNASSGYPGFAGTVWTGCRLFEQLSGERVLTGDPRPR